MSKKLNIEELVRIRLDQAEITPSPGAWKGVQRKLRVKRFLRFDPGRFNLYHLSGLVVAGAVAVVLLSRDPAADGSATIRNSSTQPAESGVSSGEPAPGQVSPEADGNQGKGGLKKNRKDVGKIEGNHSEGKHPAGREPYAGEEAGEVTGEQHPEGTKEDARAVPQTLVTYFTASSLSGCAPLQVRFVNTSMNAVSFTWSFGTGETSSEASPHHTFGEPGRYTVTLRASGEDGMSELYSQVVEVFRVPVAGFEIEEGLEGPDGVGSFELMNYSTGAFSFAWDFPGQEKEIWSSNEFQPSLKTGEIPGQADKIRLVATNSQGCTDTAVMQIPVAAGSTARELKFPTAFNANHTGPSGGTYRPNDLRIDIFHPHFTEVPAAYHLQVFSRMGEMVFESRDIYTGWDGYIREQKAAGGVYLWIAEGTWENGSAFNMKGDVTLLWSDRRWP